MFNDYFEEEKPRSKSTSQSNNNQVEAGYDVNAYNNYYDANGGYYDANGGYWDANGGYYDANGGYYDSMGGYYD